MPSGYEFRQRGGDQAFPCPGVGAIGEKTEENWYQLTAADNLTATLLALLT